MSSNNLGPDAAAAMSAARGVAPQSVGVNAAASSAASGLPSQTVPLAGSLGAHAGGVPPGGAPTGGAGLVATAHTSALGGPNQVVHPIVGGGLVNGPGNLNPVVAPIGGAGVTRFRVTNSGSWTH
jgi:hypothetical protein